MQLDVGSFSLDWVQIYPKVPSSSGMCCGVFMVKDHPIFPQPTAVCFQLSHWACLQVPFLWAYWVSNVPLV